MKLLRVLPVIALVAACADGTVVQPEADALLDPALVAHDQIPNVPCGMAFSALITLVGTTEPGETRVTPSGVIHNTGLVNEWAMTGDLTGPWYFIGGYHLNPGNGMGRSISHPVAFEIQDSKWGMTGSFTCNASFRIENFPSIIQYGVVAGCHGTGDFDGMLLEAYVTNEANPGGIVYDAYGVIW